MLHNTSGWTNQRLYLLPTHCMSTNGTSSSHKTQPEVYIWWETQPEVSIWWETQPEVSIWWETQPEVSIWWETQLEVAIWWETQPEVSIWWETQPEVSIWWETQLEVAIWWETQPEVSIKVRDSTRGLYLYCIMVAPQEGVNDRDAASRVMETRVPPTHWIFSSTPWSVKTVLGTSMYISIMLYRYSWCPLRALTQTIVWKSHPPLTMEHKELLHTHQCWDLTSTSHNGA